MKKPKVKTKFLQLAIEPELKVSLFEKARERGISLSEATRQALAVWAGFDAGFWKLVKGLSAKHGVEPTEMIQILVHDRLAENEAQTEVWETGLERPFMFQRNSDGVVLGLHDFDWRKEFYNLKKTTERQRHIEGQKRQGFPLSEDDEKFLEARHELERQQIARSRRLADRGEGAKVRSFWGDEDEPERDGSK